MNIRERESLEKLLKRLAEGEVKTQYQISSAERLIALSKNNIETDKEEALVQRCETYIEKIKKGWKSKKQPKTFEDRLTKQDEDELRDKFNIAPPKRH